MREIKNKLIFWCDKCGKEPKKTKDGNWENVEMNCSCGGRIQMDFSKPHNEKVKESDIND